MSTLFVLLIVWGVLTAALIALLIYRSRLTRQESDWIDLTDDEQEERAIQNQTLIERKNQKLTWPIRGLSVLSAVLLLGLIGYWAYQGLSTQPAP